MTPLPGQRNLFENSEPQHTRHRPAPIPPRDPSVPDPERPRLSDQCWKIIERLRQGPATNRDLAEISLKYTGRVSDCRAAGFTINVVKRNTDGLTVYQLAEGGR